MKFLKVLVTFTFSYTKKENGALWSGEKEFTTLHDNTDENLALQFVEQFEEHVSQYHSHSEVKVKVTRVYALDTEQ